IHASAERFREPAEMATHLNAVLHPHFRSLGSELFVGLFYGVLHLPSGRISYVNCGHVPPLLCTASGETEQLHTGGIVLGVSETPSYEEQATALEPGDLLVLCTDGVLGRRNPEKEEFSAEHIARIVRGHAPASAQDIADQVMAAAEQFGGREREDDATILIAARLPAANGA
ncbi:MAG: PP2C family protein-serine/threonine phosphatase, partial [Armatimonadota bacterium]